MEETVSKFNINVVRDVYILGEPHYAVAIRKLLKSYHFLQPRTTEVSGSSMTLTGQG